MSKYQGKEVTNTRAARQGDQGYDASKDQIVIQTEDNRIDQIVLRTDVKEG